VIDRFDAKRSPVELMNECILKSLGYLDQLLKSDAILVEFFLGDIFIHSMFIIIVSHIIFNKILLKESYLNLSQREKELMSKL